MTTAHMIDVSELKALSNKKETAAQQDVAELPALATKKQVADWRQVSTRKVELDCNAKIFPQPVRCGTHPRWRRSDLLAWLEAQSNGGVK